MFVASGRNSCGDAIYWTGLLVGIGVRGASCSVSLAPLLPALLLCSSASLVLVMLPLPMSRIILNKSLIFPVAAPISFSDLPNSEPDFTEEEVCRTVLKMRTGKTTGMSKVSVELLRCLVALPLGLHALTLMLNSFLRDPTTANVELASGWVILLPKTLWVCHAKNFRPIVCGEVFAKLAAKLATDRVVHHWTVPACCFGSVSGKGLPEALYIAKHAAQSSAALPNGALFVQLDLSQAFDSLFVNAILSFLQDHWLASTASSASLLRWVLLHSRLRFELFDFVWWCDQRRGAQQGGSHSPTLFGRLVAARFEQLTQTWQLQGEHPAFVAATLSLWALWFIDDAVLVFQTVAQALRLLPQVVSMLAGLGLSINVAKSCILGCSLSCALPGCLAAFPVVATSKYLGLPFQVTGENDHMVDQLCNRATAAFFSNRPILTNRLATRQHKLRLFNALVTASLRWSLLRLVCQTTCPPASSRALCDLAYVAAWGSCAPFLVYCGMLAGSAAWCEALGPGLQ